MTPPTITVHRIGREGEPVVVIDGFHPDPEQLRSVAAGASFGGAGEHYPGIRAPVPTDYLPAIRPALGAVFREAFGVAEAVSILDVRFAIVTALAADLTVEQRLPHVDALEPGRLALVHFLASEDQGGTAFYRHRATGFETIDAARSTAYFEALNGDIRTLGPPPPGYLCGDTAMFERIACFAGTPNRALVYRGRLLHCGDIAPGQPLWCDPTKGRLTVTGFFVGR